MANETVVFKTIWEGTDPDGRRVRVVEGKRKRLYAMYPIKGDPGFWRWNPEADAAAILGRKGGSAKVAKGFSTMSPERRSEVAKAAAKKRWGR